MDEEQKRRSQYFYEQATAQNNQLRIALITISLGLLGFVASSVDASKSLSEDPFMMLALLLSFVSSVVGLSSWKFASKMFWLLAKDIKSGGVNSDHIPYHKLKTTSDSALPIILALAAVATLLYVLLER